MNLENIFGTGEQLTALQMASRAFVMFFIAVVLIRIGGVRIFGRNTTFDNVLVIMFGAILARGVVGASPFFSVVAAAGIMVLIHKVLGWLAMRYVWVGMLVKGIHRSLYKNDQINWKNMRAASISKDDLMEGVRMEINSDTLDQVKEATIEKDGEISIVKK